ncbi:MAG: GNAT family N-acetyltransferase [Pirellulaceae bacterium]
MKTLAEHKHVFPMSFRLKGETIVFSRLCAEHVEKMVHFAQALPEDDLLFLERDITRQAEVEQWIGEIALGNLVTILACRGETIAGYATFDRGSARWTHHVAELRVVVAESARGLGIGRLLLELVFEMALQQGTTKLIARMTPNQVRAQSLFQRLGFEQEAVLRDNARDTKGNTHDLLVLSYHTRQHTAKRCSSCGAPILTALTLEGTRMCSYCYEFQYRELGSDG